MKYIHGGDTYNYGGEIIDFSSNINPIGTPDFIKNAIINSISEICKYPDPYSTELRKHIGEYENTDKEYIVCGAGAAELMFNTVSAIKPKNALIAVPSFAEYERALNNTDTEIVYYNTRKENGYKIDLGITEYIKSNTDIIFICNPSNPTGALTDVTVIEKILKQAEKCNTYVVVDECFNDFLDNGNESSCKRFLSEYKKLIILKSFTKMYCMPGIRLGYMMCSDISFNERIYYTRQPWNICAMAVEAGKAACSQKEYAKTVRDYIRVERKYMVSEFDKLGIEYEKPNANFIFFYHRQNLKRELIKKGVLIRDCSNYRGIDGYCYRVAIRNHEENEKLIKALKEVM